MTSTANHLWQSIDIGYQAKQTDPTICKPGAPKPPALLELEACFAKSIRDEMLVGGELYLEVDPATHKDDDWAAPVLETLINLMLIRSGKPGNVTIDPATDFLTFARDKAPRATGKGVDTRCVLRGDHWYSIRSYRLMQKSDPTKPWFPPKATTASPNLGDTIDYLIATLTWKCHPVG
jgi:hypothetical protein